MTANLKVVTSKLARWHVSTQGTLAREHVSTQSTLAREHLSTQGMLACEHVSTQGTLALDNFFSTQSTQFSKLIEIKSVLTRTIFFEIWTIDYYKGALQKLQ